KSIALRVPTKCSNRIPPAKAASTDPVMHAAAKKRVCMFVVLARLLPRDTPKIHHHFADVIGFRALADAIFQRARPDRRELALDRYPVEAGVGQRRRLRSRPAQNSLQDQVAE